MHLGRFHAVVNDLAVYYDNNKILLLMNELVDLVNSYTSAPNPVVLSNLRTKAEEFFAATIISDLDLLQPYAQDVIRECEMVEWVGAALESQVKKILSGNFLEAAEMVPGLTRLRDQLKKRIGAINDIDGSFTTLSVELERVSSKEAEIGVLLPRPIVGETLGALNSEFGKLNKLFRAINEITGADDYDPQVRTISSSWWQLFVSLDAAQVVVWVVAIERIVALLKTNLEIKAFQKQLSANALPDEVINSIQIALDQRIELGLREISADIVREHARIDDKNRLNELEVQLHQGLSHLARRIAAGAQVEINMGLPRPPNRPSAKDGEAIDEKIEKDFEATLSAHTAKLAELRLIRNRAQQVSRETEKIDADAVLLLKSEDSGATSGDD